MHKALIGGDITRFAANSLLPEERVPHASRVQSYFK